MEAQAPKIDYNSETGVVQVRITISKVGFVKIFLLYNFINPNSYIAFWQNLLQKSKQHRPCGLYHRSLEYIDWARAEFTCSDLSCLAERLGDFEKFPLPWLGEAHSTSQLGNQANRARSPRLSSWAACRLIYVFPLSLTYTPYTK